MTEPSNEAAVNRVERDKNGRIKRGEQLSVFPGKNRREALMMRRMQGLTPKAIGRLEKLMEQDENRAVAFNAAKEILDRTLGKVSTKVDVTVKTTAELHLEALVTLSQRAKDRRDQVIDAVAVEQRLIEPSNCQQIDSVKMPTYQSFESVNDLTGENLKHPPVGGDGGGALVLGPSSPHTYTPATDVTSAETESDESDEDAAIREAVTQMFTPPTPGDKEA